MKKFYLSTATERNRGIVSSILMIVAMAAMLLLLMDNLPMLILCGLGVAVLAAGLIYYALNVAKAAVVILPDGKKIRVEGVRSFELDLTNAVCLETFPVKNGQVNGRGLAFTNAAGDVIGVVPTMFTSRQGVLAEPMAMELAQELGLEFKANVPRWEYDEEAMKIHEKEVAEQQKKEAAERRAAKRNFLVAKKKVQKQMEDTFKPKK